MARSLAPKLVWPVLVLVSTTAAAQQAAFRGHVKGQQQYLSAASDSLADALGHGDSDATSIDIRIGRTWSKGHFRFDADYLLQAIDGSFVEYRNELEALAPDLFVDRARMNWLPLDDTVTEGERKRVTQSLDRFALSYSNEHWVLRLGRQAYSWANGIVFRPLDIFDPFAPDVIDDSYKPGIDAVYAQRLFADGSDLVALVVPRRDPVTGRLSRSQGSAAVKWHQFGARLQTDWLIAQDYRDKVAAIGISGSLGQAVWRTSLVPVWLDSGGTRTSFVVNFEHAWQWGSRNVSGFVEYYRNGFGRNEHTYALDELDTELIRRLARGQAFNTGRDYIAGGFRIELTPLLQIDPVLLFNANDRSALALARGSYSVAQNLSLDFGLRVGLGPAGTEFGGLPTTPGSDTFSAPPTRAYARIAFYF